MGLDDLLRRFVVDGDAPAMEELVRRTRPRLLRIARRIGASQDGEDAVQAAYHALIRRAARAPDAEASHPLGAPVLPWLVTAVVRIAYRHKAVAQRRPDAAALLARWRDETGPAEGAIRREAADASRAAVAALPSKYRDAVVLHYLDGVPVAEVAALLGVSTSAVKMRLLRGRALLRARLGPRFAGALLWIPWMAADAGAALWAGGGLVMKNKVAVVAVLLLAVAATLVGLRRAATGEAGGSREARRTEAAGVGRAPSAAETKRDVTGAGAAAPSTAAGAFISGQVVDMNGAPVPDAAVHVTQYVEWPLTNGKSMRSSPFFYPGEVEPACRTDGTGAFAVAEPVERLDAIYVVSPAYAAARVSFPKGPRTGVRVVLQEGVRATGVVRDTEGRPLVRARVIFTVGAVALAVHTDGSGRYAFDTLPSPPWCRLVSAPGYEQFADSPRQGSHEAGDFRLRRRTVIVEPVDARTGLSLPDARGVLARADGGELLYSFDPTDFDPPVPKDIEFPVGRLYAANLPELAGAGRAELECHVFAPDHRPVVHRFVLEEGKEPPHLRLELEPGAGEPVLTGRVEGARHATVEIRHYEPTGMQPDDRKPLLQTVDTSDSGAFAFAGLPPGRYRLVVRAAGMGTDARDVTVPVHGLVVDLRPAARLTVLGVDRDGEPVPDAWVHVEPAASTEGSVQEQRTGADGRAVFEGLPAGRLLVCPAHFQGFSAQRRGVPLQEVRVEPGAHTELRIEIPQARPFVLEVVNAGERPLGGIELRVHARKGFGRLRQPPHASGLVVTTDESGLARLDLFPGTYDARIVLDGAEHVFPFEVGAEPRHRVVVEPAFVLRGSVVDAKTGAPVKRIMVTLSRMGVPVFTDAEGRFAVPVPPDGDPTLCVWPDRGPSQTTYMDIPFPHYVQRELDRASLPKDPLIVRLPRIRGSGALETPVALEVVVTDAATGAPLDGAAVYVSARRDGFWHTLDAIHAGEGGRAAGRLVEADAYRLWVHGPRGISPRYQMAEFESEGGAGEIRIGASLAREVK